MLRFFILYFTVTAIKTKKTHKKHNDTHFKLHSQKTQTLTLIHTT